MITNCERIKVERKRHTSPGKTLQWHRVVVNWVGMMRALGFWGSFRCYHWKTIYRWAKFVLFLCCLIGIPSTGRIRGDVTSVISHVIDQVVYTRCSWVVKPERQTSRDRPLAHVTVWFAACDVLHSEAHFHRLHTWEKIEITDFPKTARCLEKSTREPRLPGNGRANPPSLPVWAQFASDLQAWKEIKTFRRIKKWKFLRKSNLNSTRTRCVTKTW